MLHSEKQKHFSDEEVVNELCMVNGVCYERIAQEGSNISTLEIFFSGFPRMVGLSYFPRLCQLTIVGQSIKHIEGLQCCPLLRELWVVQCQLTEISGLQDCVQLEKLYLYDNHIGEIKNLELQINLEALWLNNNGIAHVQGLHTLQKLKELNLADNTIERIGHSLDPNVSLQNLNLSGNRISSFKELTPLAGLPHLRVLALKDPASAPNPVCQLCNYATHILYHMPGLQRLDTYDVASKQFKEAAESTVMKKVMYYNMRARTAQRNLAEAKFVLTERKKALLQLPEQCIRTLSHALKNLEHELSRVRAAGKRPLCATVEEAGEPANPAEESSERLDPTLDVSGDATAEPKILIKMEALRERLTLWMKRLQEIEACYKRDLARANSMMEYTIQFILMELESVGNIRLEDGCPADPWFNSCCNLLLSRFSHSDYRAHGIVGLKIDRVTRIFNSALRLRFEDKFQSLLASGDTIIFSHRNYRRQLEHLFYIADPETKGMEKEEILGILEKGFKAAEQYKAPGRDGAIPLSNSLYLIEQPRIEHSLRQANLRDSKHNADAVPFRHGQIIISKVFVGHSLPIREGDPVERGTHPKLCSLYRNVKAKPRKSNERPSSTKTHTGGECSPRRRRWFVFDHELVLPEFIVYFQYMTGNQEQPALSRPDTDRDEASVVLDLEVLNMEPVLKAQPKLLSLDDRILLKVARANVLSQITVLNLHANSLNRIKEISCLMALRHLTISFNEFTHLHDISHMPHLEFLDASFNHLGNLDGLRGLVQLKQLDVRWNKLTKASQDAAVLRRHAPALLRLDARYNPWIRPETVRRTILGRLTTLTHLDDVMVAEEEAADAVRKAAGSKINQASLLAHSHTDGSRPRSLSLLSTAQLLCLFNRAPRGLGRELEPDWTASITSLNLDGQRISKLNNLNKLVNLRWASFNDNDICKVEGLDSCLKLEELSLNDNGISTLSGLSKLHRLNKLSVDGNQLSSLECSVLEHLPNLSFLSLENNGISSLHGIQRIRPLLELYIGSNQIATSRDIFFLKALTNLIILDLYGNPLTEKIENYRKYVVFHLSSLKALDGTAVEVTECESAKDMFGGRLNSDMVSEKLGHFNYADITNLALPSCAIRTVDMSPSDLFMSLRSVNLDHNSLTSFSGLIFLPNIKALYLNYNHIESILPRQRTQAHLSNRQILYSKVHSSGYGQQNIFKSVRETGPAVSLEPLMGSLEVLHLSHNGISNMANLQLSRLTNLKALVLQGNEIAHVEGLEGLPLLRELALDRNRIKVLSQNSFVAQGVLLELHLAENRIRELNHLSPLTGLRKLFLGMNKLQDITEIDKLEVLPSLSELSVVGNPVANNSLHRPAVLLHLSQLQVLDGVMVSREERSRAEIFSDDPSLFTQCHGVSLPTSEINLPGLLSLVPRSTLSRGASANGGLHSYMQGRHILSSHKDEAPSHSTYKRLFPIPDTKHKHSNAAQSGQTDITFRHIRKIGSNMPTTAGHLSDGNRVVITYHNSGRESRFQIGGKPPPV